MAVIGGLTFAQVGAGGWNACGATAGGVGYCWGLNSAGQLGDGTRENRYQPTPIAAPGTAALRGAVQSESWALVDTVPRPE